MIYSRSDRSRKFSNPVTPRLYFPLKSIPFDMMFIMATFVHRQEQLEAVNREVKHFVYSKKKKNFTSFRLHAFRLFSRLFAKPKYLHESCCDFFILVLTCELLKKN